MSLTPYDGTNRSGVLQPVGNQVARETQANAAEATRQAQQSVQLTEFTHIQTTSGVGVGSFDIDFPVKFSAEPVFGHGMVLPSFSEQVDKDKLAELRATYDAAWKAYEPYSHGDNQYQWREYQDKIAGLRKAYTDAKKALDDALGVSATPDEIPLCSAYVKRWKLDDQNLFVGAEMIIVCRIPGTASTPAPEPEPEEPPVEAS